MAKTLFVAKPFKLLLNSAEMDAAGVTDPVYSMGFGRHEDVPDVIAEHPFAQAHFGTEQQVNAAVSAPAGGASTTSVPTVPQTEYDLLKREADDLRAQLATETAKAAGTASMVTSLQSQLRAATERAEATDKDLTEANERIRTMVAKLRSTGATVPANAEPVTATAPATATDTPPAPEDGEGSESHDETGAQLGDLVVKHRGGGKYAVMRGDEVLTDPMSKDEANARAAELSAAAQDAPAS